MFLIKRAEFFETLCPDARRRLVWWSFGLYRPMVSILTQCEVMAEPLTQVYNRAWEMAEQTVDEEMMGWMEALEPHLPPTVAGDQVLEHLLNLSLRVDARVRGEVTKVIEQRRIVR